MSEEQSKENETTTFDETLRQLKHDPNALNKHIVNLLETQMNGNLKDEILSYRKIEALFPIISILFKDQTKVEIFVKIKTNAIRPENVANFHESITGVRQASRAWKQFLCGYNIFFK